MIQNKKVVVPHIIQLIFSKLTVHFANYRHDHDILCDDLLADIVVNGQIESVKVVEKDDGYFVVDGWKRAVALNHLSRTIDCEIIINTSEAISKYVVNPSLMARTEYEIFISLKAIEKLTGFNHQAIAKLCGISKHKIHNFFCFDEIEADVLAAIADMRLVTSSTAKAICIEQKKGNSKTLIALSSYIREGVGSTTLSRLIKSYYNDQRKKDARGDTGKGRGSLPEPVPTNKIKDINGRELFTYDGKDQDIAIHLSKSVKTLLNEKQILAGLKLGLETSLKNICTMLPENITGDEIQASQIFSFPRIESLNLNGAG
jgi:DNA polymerase I-like protein with 3'-5' exonuclease and polymerase domains